jgi:radical SAM protein with 4Fe4S-binding SPASM domain
VVKEKMLKCERCGLEFETETELKEHFLTHFRMREGTLTEKKTYTLGLKECLFEITQGCNLKCKHCYLTDKTFEGDMTTEEVVVVLDKLKSLGIQDITLLGGEPTLRPDFYTILQYCINKFKNVTVETNGTTKTNLSEYKCNVAVSFENSDPNKHDDIRGEGTFLASIMKLQRVSNPKIMRMTLYNDTDVMECMILAERLDSNLVFFPLLPIGNATALLDRIPTPEKILEAIQLCHLVTKQNVFGFKFAHNHTVQCPQAFIYNTELLENFKDTFEYRGRICEAGYRRIFVDHKGNVTPCPFLSYQLGNILKETTSFIKQNIYNFIEDTKQPLVGKCEKCEWKKYCGGGCMATYSHDNKKMGELCPLKER